MSTTLPVVSLANPLAFREFVETLQELHGVHFGSLGFYMHGGDMHLFLTEYLPSLDGWVGSRPPIPIAKVSFTLGTKPARIEYLLSAMRVLFQRGFDELFITADEHSVLTVSRLFHSRRRLAQGGVS